MKTIPTKGQGGFTLVEIAIVLVIIGLLLGGVLKGTELIESSKVKRLINDVNGISAAYNSYQDRYRAIPGDDGPTLAVLTARGGEWGNVLNFGNRNRVIATGGSGNALNNPPNESVAFWQHLRAGGFLSGSASAIGNDALPINGFGGVLGITVANVQGDLSGLKVCANQISGKGAVGIDNQLDDGDPGTGNVRGTVSTATNPGNAVLAVPYNEQSTYIICVKI